MHNMSLFSLLQKGWVVKTDGIELVALAQAVISKAVFFNIASVAKLAKL